MPEASQPVDPAVQQAQANMSQWMAQHNQQLPVLPGFAGIGATMVNIASTAENMTAAAAGQFAIAPDTGQAVITQLTNVQDEAAKIADLVNQAAFKTPLGGGYAEKIGALNQQLASSGANSADEVLTKFAEELEHLKEAVARSMGNYQGADDTSAGGVNAAGGQL